jgi:hypothetical protein
MFLRVLYSLGAMPPHWALSIPTILSLWDEGVKENDSTISSQRITLPPPNAAKCLNVSVPRLLTSHSGNNRALNISLVKGS